MTTRGEWPTLDPPQTLGAPSFALLRRMGEHEPCPGSVGSPISIEEEDARIERLQGAIHRSG
jgi:hypothetical protein